MPQIIRRKSPSNPQSLHTSPPRPQTGLEYRVYAAHAPSHRGGPSSCPHSLTSPTRCRELSIGAPSSYTPPRSMQQASRLPSPIYPTTPSPGSSKPGDRTLPACCLSASCGRLRSAAPGHLLPTHHLRSSVLPPFTSPRRHSTNTGSTLDTHVARPSTA
jgi:hypothetical protein